MFLEEREINLSNPGSDESLLDYLAETLGQRLAAGEVPVRMAVTRIDDQGIQCELGVLCDGLAEVTRPTHSIFDFQRRRYEHMDHFNAVLLVPTGIGAELGGHSGDAGPVSRLLGGACDCLITHPNVVNASDINELPANGLYVEGSVIARLLMGTVGLQRVRSNRVLVVVDEHEDEFFFDASVNSVSAARAALGLDCPLVVRMRDKVKMQAVYAQSGRAIGKIDHLERLVDLLQCYQGQYDAVALSSMIDVPSEFHSEYFEQNEMVNPWGGVEAMLTHAVSLLLDVPSAHSPMMSSKEVMDLDVGIVDPRKSAEAVSTTFLHCILKGLAYSPRLVPGVPLHGSPGLLTAADVSCLVVPQGCIGLPTLAALEQGIPVIAVRNKNCLTNRLEDLPFGVGKLFVVDNYLEAVGVMCALKSGVALDTVTRPMSETRIARTGNVTTAIHSLRDNNSLPMDDSIGNVR